MADVIERVKHIAHLDDLKSFQGQDVVIHQMIDKSVHMATIKINDVPIMSGNFSDFYPGCHGGWHYDLEKESSSWSSSNGMVEALMKALIKRGIKTVKIEPSNYNWSEFTLQK